jgi:thiol-disulfide isomerase/thioredoxin
MRNYVVLYFLVGNSLLFCQPGAPPVARETESQAAASYACKAPDDIETAITQAGRGGIKSLAARYPTDFWVQRALIDAVGTAGGARGGGGIVGGRVNEAVIAWFKEGYDALPDDPEAAYLYAYSLINRETSKSVEILTSVTRKMPSFPTAWITLAILHGYPNFYDQAKQRTYLEGFLKRCPETLDSRVASMALQLNSSDTLAAYIKALRERIAGRADQRTLHLYLPLWQLEAKTMRGAEQAQFQRQVEEDLKFLEGLHKSKFGVASSLLARGYALTGNREAQQNLSTSNQQQPMSGLQSFPRAQSEWTRANPLPPATADTATRTAYYRKQLQFLDEWRDRVPDSPQLLTLRFSALSSIPDTLDQELVREGNEVLAVLRRTRGGAGSTTFFDVLRIWAQRGLELDRVPALVEESLLAQEELLVSMLQAQQTDLYGETYDSLSNETGRWPMQTNAWGILVTAYSKNRRFDEARGVLSEWEAALDERRKRADEIRTRRTAGGRSGQASAVRSMEDSIVSGIPNDESRYNEGLAQLASGEGRTLDALAFYQTSLRLMYGRNSTPPNLAELEGGKQAGRLWKELGGTESGWQAWLESIRTTPTPRPTSVPQAPVLNRPIPEFALSDQSGKTWTLASLKGKTTLINVWATWCGPCREELPHLQTLYEQVKSRGDVQVITLNVDENTSLVEPYLKENKYTFPSLFARSFVDGFAGPIGIPTTWTSDVKGTIRFQTLGFGGDGSQWVVQTLNRMESVRDGKEQIPPAPPKPPSTR